MQDHLGELGHLIDYPSSHGRQIRRHEQRPKRERTIVTSAPATAAPNTGERPTMATESSDRTIVLHLLRGAVPERADEISALWSQYGHGVEVTPSGKDVTMNADDKRIQLDTKTIDFFWLLGFSAWRAIEVYSPALLVATWTGMPLDQALKIDAERGQYEFDYKQRISTAQSLIAAEQTTQISWPADIRNNKLLLTGDLND
jgi:hypothetical protein